MATSKGKTPEAPGTFEPDLPSDPEGVLRLFAIAGRAVMTKPEQLERVTATLSAVIGRLMPPARLAAEECARLWGLFGRMAKRAKPFLLEEGGRALYRDLDTLGQKLSLPPLPSWSTIPNSITAKHPVSADAPPVGEGESLAEVRARARGHAKLKRDPPLKAAEVFKLVGALSAEAREELWTAVVGAGLVQKSDTVLIAQVLQRGGKIGPEDDLLVTGLEAVGRWLVRA